MAEIAVAVAVVVAALLAIVFFGPATAGPLRQPRGPSPVRRRRVVIESPYAGDVDGNLAYLRDCIADSLARGEAPIASHGLYTQPGILDDSVAEDRERGIAAGLTWHTTADVVVFYTDRGWSRGMLRAARHAIDRGVATERRSLARVRQ